MSNYRCQKIGPFLAFSLLAVVIAGCGGETTHSVDVDLLDLLDKYEKRQRRHDPKDMVEIEVGEFFVTRHVDDHKRVLYVDAIIFAVIPKDDATDFQQQLDSRKNRMRNRLIATMQDVDLQHLEDGNLTWLKREVVHSLNDSLQSRSVRDVVFSKFTINRG